MRSKRSRVWQILRARWLYLRNLFTESFWFTPSLLLVGAVLLAVGTLVLDRLGAGKWLHDHVLFFTLKQETVRPILATVATAMVTASALVFSLMFVALTLASQQLGPRIISRAMSDSVTRSIFGTFVGTFIYSLIVLGGTNSGSAEIPYCSVTLAFVMVIANFTYLLYFVHHTALSIQADLELAWLAYQLLKSIREAFPERTEEQPDAAAVEPLPVPRDGRALSLPVSGYVGVIGFEALTHLAGENDCRIWLQCQPGDYVIAGAPVAFVDRPSLDAEVLEDIHSAIVLGSRRTAAQDFAFQMRAIVDIGMRALSPALNDFHTANSSLDWISGAVAEIMLRRAPAPVLCDDNGAARVFKVPVPFERVVLLGYQQLFEAMQPHPTVLLHLLYSLTVLAGLAREREHKDVIAAFGGKVEAALARLDLNRPDRARADDRLAMFKEACAR